MRFDLCRSKIRALITSIRRQGSFIHGDTSSDLFDGYHQWREDFFTNQLTVFIWLPLIANPMFIAADRLLYPDTAFTILKIRGVMEACLVAFLIWTRLAIRRRHNVVIFVGIMLICGFTIAHMTLYLGGFDSTYFQGLSLLFLAAAVTVPACWHLHLFSQVAILLYYYGINITLPHSEINVARAIENSFFLSWTSVCTVIAVVLYERLHRAEFQSRCELKASNSKLMELDRLKSEFFANISHELRTPLTLIAGMCRTLLTTPLTGPAREMVQVGQRNTHHLLELINELLDLAKFDSGRAKLSVKCIDLSSLVRRVAANFESSTHRRIHFRGFHERVPIVADPAQLKKVFSNLLANAFKFNNPDKAQVWLRLRTQDDSVEIEVEDNGIGIPRDQLTRVFDRFTQVEGSTNRRYEGTGIGLALVKEIIALHGGQISVESEEQKGSVFTVTLPRSNPTLAAIEPDDQTDLESCSEILSVSAQVQTGPNVSPPAQTSSPILPHILIAEDHPDLRNYLRTILSPAYRVTVADDGCTAFELAKATPPDLILTDVMMPRVSGSDLLKLVRADERLKSTPVIFLTAQAGTEARVDSLEAGADDYLSKPFDEPELLARVKNLLRVRSQERQLAELHKEKLKRFLPAQVAELLDSEKAEEALRTHRREITAVFIDLRGFTAFTEAADPEDVMTVLREYQAVIGEQVKRYGGTLERFIGDALMIYFNDPIPISDHAQQAVRMALAIRGRMDEQRGIWMRRGFDLNAGLGIATGFATMGVVGFDDRWDYAGIGTVTNLAARLCAEASAGQILIANRTAALIEPFAHLTPIGELILKGFHRPVTAFIVLGMRDVMPTLERT